jgi:symplekin
MAQQVNLNDQMTQLEAARKLVLGDAALYPQVVQGILPIIGANARLELRRWGAEFLAETFASPALAAAQKEQLVCTVLPTLRELLDNNVEDMAVVKSVVQTVASLFPHVFRHM